MGDLRAGAEAEAETGDRSYEPSQDSSPPDTVSTKEEKDVERHDTAESPDESTAEYTYGKRLAVIVFCLMLSVFLVALDNVSDCTTLAVSHIQTDNYMQRPLLQRPSPKSPTNSTVSARCRGMARHTL